MTTAAGPTDAPVASAGLVDSPPQVSTGSQPDRPRQIGFAAGSVVTVEPSRNAQPPGTGNKRNPPAQPPGPNPPVAGTLPDFPLVSWEQDRDGGWECWHAPEGAKAARRTKTYLGRVGKRKLAEWDGKPNRLELIGEWVSTKREEKGIPFGK